MIPRIVQVIIIKFLAILFAAVRLFVHIVAIYILVCSNLRHARISSRFILQTVAKKKKLSVLTIHWCNETSSPGVGRPVNARIGLLKSHRFHRGLDYYIRQLRSYTNHAADSEGTCQYAWIQILVCVLAVYACRSTGLPHPRDAVPTHS